MLILLDGFGSKAESILAESRLPFSGYEKGILTVSAAMGEKIYADSSVIHKLNRILNDVIKKYKVSRNQFVIGGFSAGGTIALRYTELCKENPSDYPVDPKAVFTVDSPVDIIALWDFFGKQISKNYSAVAVNEAKLVSDIMSREHGPPSLNLNTYKWLTPFYSSQTEEGNEKFLKNMPVRVYHDIDVRWQLENRRRSIYESNYLNSSELILRLMLAGNQAAEFIAGKKGYRSNGTRHPHSWSIVDEAELIEWVKKIVTK